MPTKVGIHLCSGLWIPAFTGMTFCEDFEQSCVFLGLGSKPRQRLGNGFPYVRL